MMTKLNLQFLSFMAVIAVASALSCACSNPSPNLSNALYNKKYAVKVRVKKEIENPVPVNPQLPWRANYYKAKVKKIFKQEHSDDLSEDEDIVVMGGLCNVSPEEKTAYIVFSSSLQVMDVPGFGKAKVLAMPSFCEYSAKWEDLPDERVKQLRRYMKKGEKPCFEGDCDWQNVAFATAMCPDGSSPNMTIVCEYNEKSNMCQQDMEVDDCPPLL